MSAGLVADVGGTNARFAWVAPDGSPETLIRLETGAFPSFEEALAQVIADRGERPSGIAIAAAGPVKSGVCALTNATWLIDVNSIRNRFDVPRVHLINDLAAVALSIPALRDADLMHLAGPASAEGHKLALGVGTGVGTALLTSDGVVIPSEGGHIGWASLSPEESSILSTLVDSEGYLPAEAVLAGPGLAALYRALAPDGAELTPVDVFSGRLQDAAAGQAVAIFTRMLGRFAGDAALLTGASGGVYLTGGVLTAWGDAFDATAFLQSFCGKGRFRSHMEQVPVYMITEPEPAVVGLAALVSKD